MLQDEERQLLSDLELALFLLAASIFTNRLETVILTRMIQQNIKPRTSSIFLKQPPRGVTRKKCFEKMQQIYWRTPMPKCDFNKVALQLY